MGVMSECSCADYSVNKSEWVVDPVQLAKPLALAWSYIWLEDRGPFEPTQRHCQDQESPGHFSEILIQRDLLF